MASKRSDGSDYDTEYKKPAKSRLRPKAAATTPKTPLVRLGKGNSAASRVFMKAVRMKAQEQIGQQGMAKAKLTQIGGDAEKIRIRKKLQAEGGKVMVKAAKHKIGIDTKGAIDRVAKTMEKQPMELPKEGRASLANKGRRTIEVKIRGRAEIFRAKIPGPKPPPMPRSRFRGPGLLGVINLPAAVRDYEEMGGPSASELWEDTKRIFKGEKRKSRVIKGPDIQT